MIRFRHAALIGFLLASCAPHPIQGGTGDSPAPNRAAESIPAGRGTLHQDQFTVSLRDGALLIKVTPLSEEITGLAAPDTYARLHALVENRQRDAAMATGVNDPELFLVAFFSYQPETLFQPEDLLIRQQGRLLRPLAILPVTPDWGRQRLRQQEIQSAIYAFDPAIDPTLPMTIRYGSVESDDWARILPRLQAERAKVEARTE